MKNPEAGQELNSPITEEDLARIEALDLTSPSVLDALSRVLGIRLETVNPDRAKWYATPRDGAVFEGSLAEVAAYVRGYAIAYRGKRQREKGLARALTNFMEEAYHRGNRTP